MLKVKKTTYGSLPKNNERTKLTTEIKQAMKKTKQKTINDYREFIQSIKRISKVRHRK